MEGSVEAVSFSFDDLDAVVDTFEAPGMDGLAGVGDAPVLALLGLRCEGDGGWAVHWRSPRKAIAGALCGQP